MKTLARAAIAVLLVLPLVPAAATSADKPPTGARINDTFDTTGKRLILKYKVIGAKKGTVARVSCKGGKSKGCPAAIRGGKTKKIVAKRAGSMSLSKALKGNKLRKGAVVTIKLTDPGALYYKLVTTVLSATSAASQGTCEQPGAKPVGCA